MANTVKFIEILTTHNRKNLSSWKFHGPVMMGFDENTKGYVLDCNGGTMQVPNKQTGSLKLIRPFLLFQIYLYPGKLLTLELSVTDSQGSKRRIMLTQCKNVIINMMHSRLPNSFIEKNSWMHLYINVQSLFSLCFPSSTFRSIDSISLSAFCKLRRIYSLSEMYIDYLLPSGFELPKYIQLKTQLITSDSFENFLQEKSSNVSSSMHKNPKSSSLSLPKISIKKKSNIFYDNQKLVSLRQSVNELKKEYEAGNNLGAKVYFRKADYAKIRKMGMEMEKEDEAKELGVNSVRMKEKLKKITHVHYQENHEGEIEESIEIDDKSENGGLIEEIKGRMNLKFGKFETPDFYNSNLKIQLQHRHVTPPFVNGNFVYNPQEKSYEKTPNI